MELYIHKDFENMIKDKIRDASSSQPNFNKTLEIHTDTGH